MGKLKKKEYTADKFADWFFLSFVLSVACVAVPVGIILFGVKGFVIVVAVGVVVCICATSGEGF